MKNFRRRVLPVFLSLLLIFSTLFPIEGLAQTQPTFTKEPVSGREISEKEREKLFSEETVPSKEDTNDEFYSLVSGLGFVPRGIEDKEPAKKIDPSIYEELENKERVRVLIKMKDQINYSKMFQDTRKIRNRANRILTVKNQLERKAKESQAKILSDLAPLESKGQIEILRSFWINNSILAEVDKETIKKLNNRDDVKEVILDKIISLPDITVMDTGPNLPTWGLEKINATKVWGDYGIKGEGIVVGIMDTGVDWTHEALKDNYRGRDGNHQYSWKDFTRHNYQTPTDGHGHGTHVAGTAVGGGNGLPIGVAPKAEWIAAKIFDDSGSATTSGIHAAFEWFLAPGGDPSKAPHVVNNSWGNSNTYTTEYFEDVAAWISAGIFPLFAAGNNGPLTSSISAPASYTNAFAVGATDQYNYVTDFSSRGPVYWENDDGQRELIIKPDIMAPGYQIYSAYPESLGKGKYVYLSGTSMATPHVAGAIALLLSADPSLSIPDIQKILVETAQKDHHMGELPNNIYGNGVIDIYRAVTETVFSGILSGSVVNEQGNPIEATISIASENMTIQTDEKGNFERKIREGTYQVKVSSFGYQTLETTVTLVKGEKTEVKWTLASSPTYELSGQVMSEDGPISFGYVRIKNTPLKPIYTDHKGNFTFPSVPSGSYEVQVNGENVKGKTIKVELSENKHVTIHVEASHPTETYWKTVNNNYHRNPISPNIIADEELLFDWDYRLGSKGSIVFSTPAVDKDRIILITEKGWVISLDADNGEEQWSIRFGESNRSSPTVENGVVFVSGGDNQHIYAIDASRGTILWELNIGQYAIYESPIYKDGRLYVTSGVMPTNSTQYPKVYALHAETGEVIWSYTLDGSSYASSVLGDDYLYVGTYESRTMRALHPETGEMVWSLTLEGEGFSARPAYQNGILYAISNNFNTQSGTLHAIDGKTGKILWSVRDIGTTQMTSPIIFEDIVITGSAVYPVLRAFDAKTGTELWRNEEVGIILNNGSVSANGTLYVAGINGYLYSIDIYSGNIINRIPLDDVVYSGIPLVPGKVYLPYSSGVKTYSAPGTIKGQVLDENGVGLSAKITVLETGKSVDTDEAGNFLLTHTPGHYTLQIASYGYKQENDPVTILSGHIMDKSYRLNPGDTGSLTITVKNKRTGEPLEGATVTLLGTPFQEKTGDSGTIRLPDVTEGTYLLQTDMEGFVTNQEQITVFANQETAVNVFLQPYDIAVLNDYNGEVTKFLNNNGYFAVEKGWDVIDTIDRYKIIYLNGAYTTSGVKPEKETIHSLVQAAKEKDVSLVFVDTWGSSYGTIQHLVDYYGDPKELSHEYNSGKLFLRVDQEHPILKGYSKGDFVNLSQGVAGDFAWFHGYSGISLATIGSDRTYLQGTGIAFKGVTEHSAHLLLSSHAASPWISPNQGWTKDMAQILLNGIDYLLDAKYTKIDLQIVDENNEPIDASIEILNVNRFEGSSRLEYFLDPGEYQILVRAPGYETEERKIELEYGKPYEATISLQSSDGSSLIGTVTDSRNGKPLEAVTVSLFKGNEEMDKTTTGPSGFYEFRELNLGEYMIKYEKDGYVLHKENVELKSGANELNVSMIPTPKIAVFQDYSSTGRNFVKIFDDIGVKVTQLNTTNLLDRIGEFDVVFLNDLPTSLRGERIDELFRIADQAKTSLIFGDTHYDSAPINQLSIYRQDPEVRDRRNDNGQAAIYVVEKEHPIFQNHLVGDEIEIRIPTRGRIAFFDGYSGYVLAKAGQKGSSPYGLGVAYKPRTKDSVELLMSGHGFDISYYYDHYTEEGKQLLINAVLWAAYAQFPTISGIVTDSEGNPLTAHIQVVGESFSGDTNPETGEFSIAIEGGEYEIEISSFGYETLRIPVTAALNGEPLNIVLEEHRDIGKISGKVVNGKDGFAIDKVDIEIIGYPRKTTTNLQGNFTFEQILPGTYTIRMVREGFAERFAEVEVKAGETTEVILNLLPSPKVGILGDYTQAGSTLKEYLASKGYLPEDVHFRELDRIKEFDIIIANFDYVSDKSLEPKQDEFEELLKAIDQARIPVIWTGHVNDRGGIRFLNKYENNPSEVINGSSSNTPYFGMATLEHPITQGVPLDEPFPIKASFNYHYAFLGYDGETILDVVDEKSQRVGSMIAYKARTIDSVEILMANFTFSYYYHPALKEFDPYRERLLSNALHWALEYDEILAGELYGQVVNQLGVNVQATVTVLETGKKVTSDENGRFFLGLQEGTYTLRFEAFGHEPQEFTLSIGNGERRTETFTLTAHDSGLIKGYITDQEGQPLKGANLYAIDTPITTKTDDRGYFEMLLPVGTYHVEVSYPGYMVQIRERVPVSSTEDTELYFVMQPVGKIIVITNTTTNVTRFSNFLGNVGYDADYHTSADLTPIIENIHSYSVIIYNDKSSSTTDAQFRQLIDAAREHNVSIIFSSQFSGGTIRELNRIYGDPESVSWGYKANHINIKVVHDHPLYAGIDGEEFRIFQREGTQNQQYAIYQGYSGTTIGQLSHDSNGVLGDGIGYTFTSGSSVHLLLSGFQFGSYSDPQVNWTEEGKRFYLNAINWAILASLGEIKGTVTNQDREPISGAIVSVPALGYTTATDNNGEYRLSLGTGTYEVKVSAFGYYDQMKTIEITETGQTVQLDFVLDKVPGKSISGIVRDANHESVISGAEITLTVLEGNKEVGKTFTDSEGRFTFNDLMEGDYRLTIVKDGYRSEELTVTLGNESIELALYLKRFEIGVLGDFNGELSSFLNRNGYLAEPIGWDILGSADDYKLIIVNENNGTKLQMLQLIHETDLRGISLLFLGTWGIRDGSVHLLKEALGYPDLDQHGYNEGPVTLHRAENHPLFKDLPDVFTIHSENSPYATFKNYPGVNLATLYTDEGMKGTAITYQFRSANSIHLILSSFAVTNIIGPDHGWTEDGEKLFLNAIDFAMDAKQEKPVVPTFEQSTIQSKDGKVVITGRAAEGDIVKIYSLNRNQPTELGRVVAQAGGYFTFEYTFNPGNYTLFADSENYTGKSSISRSVRVTVTGSP